MFENICIRISKQLLIKVNNHTFWLVIWKAYVITFTSFTHVCNDTADVWIIEDFLTKHFELRFGLNWTTLGREYPLKKLETMATEEERNRRLKCEASARRFWHFHLDNNIISKQHFNLDNNVTPKTKCHWDYNRLEEDSDTS